MSHKRHRSLKKVKDLDAFDQINLNAAGIDVGANEFYVAVPKERSEESVRSFLTYTADIHHLADWLKSSKIETVAMESTVVFWIPLYDILES